MKKFIWASEIANLINGKLIGKDRKLFGISLLRDANENDLVVLYKNQINMDINTFQFGTIIIPPKLFLPIERTFIVTTCDIHNQWYKIVDLFIQRGIYSCLNYHTPQEVSPSVLGNNTIVGSNVFFGKNTIVGENCIIGSNVVIGDNVVIGNNVTIECGAIIGNESYQFCTKEKELIKINNIGTVIIGDNVEIGANTTIDRGTIGNTIIGNGTKIGNLVQIGHEAIIGQNCMIIAQVGIAGWAEIGDNVTIYGQSGISNFVSVGNNTTILAKSGVTKNTTPNSFISGMPAGDHYRQMRIQAFIRKLYRKEKTK